MMVATFGGIVFWRNVAASVKTKEHSVRVRNVFRTIELPWIDIEDIRMVQVGGEARSAVRLILRNGRTVAMDVLDGDSESGSLRGRRQQAALEELRSRHPRLR